MQKSDLKISIIQSDIIWENIAANLAHYEEKIHALKGLQHIIVLPEMFSTGFSMSPEKLAEPMNGSSVQWLKKMAAENRSIITGSLIIEAEGHYYNRMLWVLPNGEVGHYDKRHLFSYADEHKHYAAGEKRFIASVNGWKICLLVCYDLRFPVWSRNTDDYDAIIYVANWPEQRNMVWETLLQARAIENMSYVVGVNRVGTDGNGHKYIGNSSIYNPLGELIWKKAQDECIHTATLSYTTLEESRQRFNFLDDRDKFILL
jgi:omega-amidase